MMKGAVIAAIVSLPLASCTEPAGVGKLAEDSAAADGKTHVPEAQTMAKAEPAEPPRVTGTKAPQPIPSLSTRASQNQESGARAVLDTWAQALENRQFAMAWEQFRDPPAERAAFVKSWQRYRTIRVALQEGILEGAAGSMYYSAPATVTGTTADGRPFRLEGRVFLRRVNDVPGATAEQRQWGIASAVLKDA